MTALSDDEIMELAGQWFHTGENQHRADGYYYRSLGTPSNVRGSDLIAFARALLAAQPAGAWLPTAENINALPEPSFSADQVRAYAIQAVMAERDRCAKLAHDWPAPTAGRIPLEIAAAIRAQPEPKA